MRPPHPQRSIQTASGQFRYRLPYGFRPVPGKDLRRRKQIVIYGQCRSHSKKLPALVRDVKMPAHHDAAIINTSVGTSLTPTHPENRKRVAGMRKATELNKKSGLITGRRTTKINSLQAITLSRKSRLIAYKLYPLFPIVGRKNRGFSNHWKNLSQVFQSLSQARSKSGSRPRRKMS